MAVVPLIHLKITEIAKQISPIGKDRVNKQPKFSFNFRGIDDLYNALQPLFAEHEVYCIPKALEHHQTSRVSSSGSEMIHTNVKMKYTLYAADGSNVSAVVIGEAADSGDKSTNKAMSAAQKYFFLQTFIIPTQEEKDPDAESHDFVAKEKEKTLPPQSEKVPVKNFTGSQEEVKAFRDYYSKKGLTESEMMSIELHFIGKPKSEMKQHADNLVQEKKNA